MAFGLEALLDAALADDAADSDNDRIPNLVEYVLGRNPRAAETSAPFTVSGPAEDREYDVELRLKRNKNARDAAVDIEVSGDLNVWTNGASCVKIVGVTDDGNGVTETVRASVRAPVSERRQGFIRMRAWRP